MDQETTDTSGFEIDKIEIPQRTTAKGQLDQPSGESPEPGARKPLRSKISRQRLWLYMGIVGFMLVMIAAVVFSHQRETQQIPLNLNGSVALPEKYLRVGPISTTINDQNYVKMTLDIGCKNTRAKEKLSRMKQTIQNKAADALTGPDCARYFTEKNFDAIRSRIKSAISDLAPDDAIEEIYFSEFLTYR